MKALLLTTAAVLAALTGCTKHQPTVPITPFANVHGDSLCFFTTSTDPANSDIQYVFDWGDGSGDTTVFFASGDTIHCGHSFADSGSYSVRARAMNERGAESGWSEPCPFRWSQAPTLTDTISGPNWWGTDRYCRFSVTVEDPDGDSVSARFIAGNGTRTDWSAFVAGGDTICDSLMFPSPANLTVQVLLRDNGNTISGPLGAKPVKVSLMAVLWATSDGDTWYCSSPVLGTADGRTVIYAISDDGEGVQCFRDDGSLKWSTELNLYGDYAPSLSPDGSRLYTGDEDEGLYCLDTDNGAILWHLDTICPCGTPAVGPDGGLYVTDYCGDLLRISDLGDSARIEWCVRLSSYEDLCAGAALGKDGTVYAMYSDWSAGHAVLAAITPDGAILWQDSTHITCSDYPYPPVIDSDGRLILGDDCDGTLYCFNPDGTLAWSCTNIWPFLGCVAVGHDNRLYFPDDNCYLTCVDRDGNVLWSVEPKEGAWENTPVIAADSTIIVYDSDYEVLYGFNPEGEQLWGFWAYDSLYPFRDRPGRDEGMGLGSPIIGPDGNIYLAGYLLGVSCISFGDARLADTPWPTYNHDPARSGWAGRE